MEAVISIFRGQEGFHFNHSKETTEKQRGVTVVPASPEYRQVMSVCFNVPNKFKLICTFGEGKKRKQQLAITEEIDTGFNKFFRQTLKKQDVK